MIKDYRLIERKPTVKELFELRKSVKWSTGEMEAFERGLQNSLYGICAVLDEKIIGTARVVGDGSTCFYIQDVIVKPEYQKMGIGSKMMQKVMGYIKEHACSGAIVGLMAAKNKEGFYEKFGFWKRPNEHFGHGMMQFWEKTEQKRFKLFLFDVDGVLIRLPRYFSSVNQDNGFENAAAIIDEFYSGPDCKKCDLGLLDPQEAIKPYVERIGWEKSPADYLNAQYTYEKDYLDMDLIALIEKLRNNGYACFLATNQNPYRGDFLLNEMGLKRYFDGWFISSILGSMKEQNGFWEKTISELKHTYSGIALDEILFIDDWQSNIVTAKHNGLSTFHAESEESISDLKALLRQVLI